jgi:hypothetical protein
VGATGVPPIRRRRQPTSTQLSWPDANRRGRGRERGAGQAGFGRGLRKEAGGPLKVKVDFSFYFLKNSNKSIFLSNKNSFSLVDPKTKVVQNFILYNIILGYILKFQLDFEVEI